jgi:outer membrane biogenesis lipoprotein LolB
MNSLIHWFMTDGNALALLVTVGVALFLACCLECTTSPSRDKDEIFRRHEL